MRQRNKQLVYSDKGKCTQSGKSRLKICGDKCPYQTQLARAESAPRSLFNFSSFLYQKHYAERFVDARKLLIIDEAHNVESQIMNFVEVVIDGSEFNMKLPSYETVEEYIRHFEVIHLAEEIRNKMRDLETQIVEIVGDDETDVTGLDRDEIRQLNDLIRDRDKYETLLGKYLRMKEDSQHVECIADFSARDNKVEIKPLTAEYHAPKILLDSGVVRLFMSATILNPVVFAESIGLDPSETCYVRTPNVFPVENRPVIKDYAGSMKWKNRQATMPKMIKKVDNIMARHAGEKGIIHCQSFKIMESIMDGVNPANRGRLLTQNDFPSKKDMLMEHAQRVDSVIIAPAMHEGLDLHQNSSRYQLIIKVPYPDFTRNKQMKIRMDRDWKYYLWLAALKLVQSYGRSIRSEDDWAKTYILDSDFDRFLQHAERHDMLPDWFIEAIVD
jgi:Rad3-related DNA helicase